MKSEIDKINIKDLDIIDNWKKKSYKIGVTNGCFDLLHRGHKFSINQAKYFCDRLIVGVATSARKSPHFVLDDRLAMCQLAFSQFDSVDVVPSQLDFRHFLRVLGRIFGGYVLIIPDSSRWIDLVACALFAIVFVIITLVFLRRSRLATIFFLTGNTFLFAFNFSILSDLISL